jgi:hypothetical protein
MTVADWRRSIALPDLRRRVDRRRGAGWSGRRLRSFAGDCVLNRLVGWLLAVPVMVVDLSVAENHRRVLVSAVLLTL